ncbi:hypothetical protein HYW58_00460 [Candidatus Kaiserbacteria bacterium]|nr:hypothetical protein [Candidatus Kaiserbacteria bacterium]
MQIKEALQTIGLNDKQASVYIALLQLGQTSAYAIALKSGLKKSTTYVILDELVEKGLGYKIPRTKKQLYAAKLPREVFALADERLKIAKQVLPELVALTKTSGVPVRTQYFEGLKQMRDAYFDTLNYPEKEMRGWISDAPFKETGKELWYTEYQPKRIKNKIRLRIVVPNTKHMKAYAANDAETLKETRVETYSKYAPESEMLLYGDSKIVITSFEEMMAIIVESKKVYELLSGIFEAHWRALGDKDTIQKQF